METASATGSTDPGGLGGELKQDAQKLGSVAGERLTQEADSRKGAIATQARSVSQALEKAAGELGGQDTPDWLRSSLQNGAQTLQRLADRVENRDPRELLNDLNTLGRQHPGAFLGACALAGFAVARVFKAGTGAASGSGMDSTSGMGGTSGIGATSGQINDPLGASGSGQFSGTAPGSSAGNVGGSYVPSDSIGIQGLAPTYTEGAV
jgi:hypothetical protein